MKRNNINKLAAAIAASALVGATVVPSFSYDVDPAMFLDLVEQQVAADQTQTAQALVQRLQSFGVRTIMIGDIEVTLAELLAILLDPTPESRAAIADLAAAARTGNIAFVTANRTLRSVDSAQFDSFPVGSAG
ncbi:MAG: hypothetical protein JWR39_1124 [Devosia sp.]|jgi:hypothetical protein|nr:hypothetical protein [Devosia sp.]